MMGMAIAALARRDAVELLIGPMDPPVVFFEKGMTRVGNAAL
jgi:hypothetical protein